MNSLIRTIAALLVESEHAIALTGAGISTESGIPDFRGPTGVWTKDPDAERRAYRGYDRFLKDPKSWWEERLSAPLVLGDLDSALPNAGHYALAELEELGVLKCVITQNVDGLHEKAGSWHVIEYHGSLLKYRCVSCGRRYDRGAFDLAQLRSSGQLPPKCATCGGVVKTDGVSFGEPIPSDVAESSIEQALLCDVMLICGTSAVVYPFANLPRIARERAMLVNGDRRPAVTIAEVNAEATSLTRDRISNYLIQGKTGEILPLLAAAVRDLRG